MFGETSIRVFVAIPIQIAVSESLLHQAEKQLSIPKKLLYTPDQMHLTLNFIGWVKSEFVNKVLKELSHIVKQYAGFNLITNNWAVLGQQSKSAVVALIQHSEELIHLHQLIYNHLLDIGVVIKDGYDFLPHVTCCRAVFIDVNNVSLPAPVEFFVDRIALYRSEINTNIKRYSIIKEFVFNGCDEI